jgi:hypothetical protein
MDIFNDVIPISIDDYYKQVKNKPALSGDINNYKLDLFKSLKGSNYKSLSYEGAEYFILYGSLSILKRQWYYVDLISKQVDGLIKIELHVIVQNGIILNGTNIKLKDRKTLEKLFLLKELVV